MADTATDRDAYLRDLAARLTAPPHERLSERRAAEAYGKSRTTIRRDKAEALARFGPDAVRPNGSANPNNIKQRALTPADVVPLASLSGGRASIDNMGRVGGIVPPGDDWRVEDVDPDDLRRMAPAELMQKLVRVSPEIARAYFDFLRMANPGHDIDVFVPGTEEPHEDGQLAVEAFERELARRNGTANAVYNRLLAGIWLRGAFFAELVLDRAGRVPLNIATPDPYTVRFRVSDDPDLGTRWEMVQKQGKDWVNIERPTVKYVAFDPLPDSPYGVSPVAPALFPALFILRMLQDAQRVIQQQGWPRHDIEVDDERIGALLDDDVTPEEMKEWVDAAVAEVSSAYSRLKPDDTFVHSSTVKINEPKGTIGDLSGIDAITELLERMNVRALKTMPLLLGMTDNTSEANANRQWEIHGASIAAMQDVAEQPLSDLFTLMLNAQGIQAEARFRFDTLRSAEESLEADTLAKKLANAETMERLGYETHDAAAQYAVGHEPPAELEAEEEEPPAVEPPTDEDVEDATDATDGEDDTGRIARAVVELLMREAFQPAGDAPTAALPSGDPGNADLDRAVAEWDARVPDARGMLDATVEEPEDNDDDA